MAIRKILTDENESLRKTSKEVAEFDDKLDELLDDMKETLISTKSGCGLAAVQVGVLKRIFVVMIDGTYLEFVNPVIISAEKICTRLEGCLSVPGKEGYVQRPKKVTISAQDRQGFKFEFTSRNPFLSQILSHEFDHLQGILYTDKLVPKPEGAKK